MMDRTIAIAPVRKSLRVNAPPARAVRGVHRMSRWWPATHTILKSPFKEAVIEPREGGRWYHVGEDGSECETGLVQVWDPPGRVVLIWQLNPKWEYDPKLFTEVEVTSCPTARTRVELEHRNIQRMGEGAETARRSMARAAGRLSSKNSKIRRREHDELLEIGIGMAMAALVTWRNARWKTSTSARRFQFAGRADRRDSGQSLCSVDRAVEMVECCAHILRRPQKHDVGRARRRLLVREPAEEWRKCPAYDGGECRPRVLLRLRGALGPFQSTGMDGAMNFVLTPNKQGTQVQLVYNIGGYVWGDFQALPKSADGVLGLQLFRLKQLIETGSADTPRPVEEKKP